MHCSNFALFPQVFKGSGLLPVGALVAVDGNDSDSDKDDDVDEELSSAEENDERGSAGPVHQEAGDLIEYDSWRKKVVRLADGTDKMKSDFSTIEVPLVDYWTEVKTFFLSILLSPRSWKMVRSAFPVVENKFQTR